MPMSSLQEIRDWYNVPAKKGMKIAYFGGDEVIIAQIIGAGDHSIKVITDDGVRLTLHPVRMIKYIETKKQFRFTRPKTAKKLPPNYKKPV